MEKQNFNYTIKVFDENEKHVTIHVSDVDGNNDFKLFNVIFS